MQKSDCFRILALLVVVFLFFITATSYSAIPDVMRESFDYPEGDLLGQGGTGNGWAGPWSEPASGSVIVLSGNTGFEGIPQPGGFLEVSESGTIWRTLEETWPDDGTTYWISFLYERFDTYEVNDSYNGYSLFLGESNELLYIGKPWASTMLGMDAHGASGAVFSEIDSYSLNWLVVKLAMNGTAANDRVYLWINPDPAVEPDTTDADVSANWRGSGGFDRVRIGSGNSPSPCECVYDEICMSKTYAGLTGGADGVLPQPVNFYDFEETEGMICIDQGTAGNNGEMIGAWIDRADGGIITRAGESGKCIKFPEENAFGELAYVFVPYRDYMNSPDYTLSAWVQYTGTPNWGYLFWADGDVWEPDLMDRHIDVWFNPNNGQGGGVDCILNCTDGSQLRVANNADETGIGVMDGDWHQVTCVLKDNMEYTIYLDGAWAKDDEGAATAEVVENIGDDLYIGARPNDADALTAVKWVGLIDRVRIWDQALTEDQIEYLYKMEGPNGGSVRVDEKISAPTEFALKANYPNPFNPTTTISYSLDKPQEVSLEIYDLLGHKVRTLAAGLQAAGDYSVQWNSLTDAGQPAPSGVYLYRLTSGAQIETRKMMLLK